MKIISLHSRIFTTPDKLEGTISFYETLAGVKCSSRFGYPEKELELAVVDKFLIISGAPENVEPFKHTQITLLVDSIEDYRNYILSNGGKITEEPKKVPTGYNMHAVHPDGLTVEYVEHTKK